LSQFNWTVVGQHGKKYQIGLYHGNRSGHLMVYCNRKVMLIDFSVLESKTYTFFLDEELCELSLERHGDHFRYGLNLNKEADTPLNRRRKILDKQNAIKAGLFLGGILLFIGLLITGIHYFQTHQPAEKIEERLLTAGRSTLVHLSKPDNSQVWTYFYVVDNTSYSFKKTNQQLEKDFPYPLPLQNGDEFQILYDASNPNIHRIVWDQPTEKVVERLASFLRPLLKEWHPEKTTREINCQLEVAYELEGLDGFSDLYQQNEPDSSENDFNQNSYLRLIRSESYQNLYAEKCW
jgi:hypothetical protein